MCNEGKYTFALISLQRSIQCYKTYSILYCDLYNIIITCNCNWWTCLLLCLMLDAEKEKLEADIVIKSEIGSCPLLVKNRQFLPSIIFKASYSTALSDLL